MLVRKALVTHINGTCLHNTERPLAPPVEEGQLRRALEQHHTIKSFGVANGVALVKVASE